MASRKPKPRDSGAPPRPARAPKPRDSGEYWLYGVHPLRAALANPARRVRRVVATEAARRRVANLPPETEPASTRDIAALAPPGAVHQGCAALVAPLAPPPLAAVLAAAPPAAPLAILDGVTDPRNVGAILRSAAAFGAAAVVATHRQAPAESGALAKAAAGGLDAIPFARVGNLARALAHVAEAGWRIVGLEETAPRALADARLPDRCALVIGAEGAGLRRLTRAACHECAALPLPGAIASLNVSSACAIALYAVTQAARRRRGAGGAPVR